MKQEDLLLIDLCSRLYYKVKVSLIYNNEEYKGTLCAIYPEDNRVIIDDLNKSCHYYNQTCGGFLIDENKVKPYLFPLSSMTEEQFLELTELCNMYDNYHDYNPYEYWGIQVCRKHIHGNKPCFSNNYKAIDWFNKNHFDYRGLIPMGSAIDATGLGIYP